MHHGYILEHLISTCSLITALYFQSFSLIRAVPPSNGQGCVTQPDNCDLCVLIVLFGLRPPSALHSRCTHSLAHTRCDARLHPTWRVWLDVVSSQSADRSPQQEALMKKQCATLDEIMTLTNQVGLRNSDSDLSALHLNGIFPTLTIQNNTRLWSG